MSAATLPGDGLSRHFHLAVPVGVIAMLALILVPMPTPILDLLITLNVAGSILILLSAMYLPGPTQFSAFPSLLLMVTLFRLSLNIASTRLILLDGAAGTSAAGSVIQAFGSFVTGGSFTVGIVVFLVLLVVQFVVIAHGSTRISEVTARFTLDAMPGKQMAIDADLNAGLITERDALERRAHIQKESEFFGSMDGAVRFTQRDAIASLLITIINIVAGLAIGVMQHGMDISEALRTFSVLTIGDGLVSAIPALFIAVGGGVITTRAAQEGNLGETVVGQLLFNKKPLQIAAGTLLLLGLVPGLPTIAFLCLSAGAFAASRIAGRAEAPVETEEEPPMPATAEDLEDEATRELEIDPLCVELGYELLQTVGAEKAGGVLDKIRSVRNQIASDFGFVLPPVRVRDNLQLPRDSYRIMLRGVPVAQGTIPKQRMLALDSGAARKIEGEETRDPAFGLPALWIEPRRADEARANGYTVVDPPSALSTHLTEVIQRNASELLGREDVAKLVTHLEKSHPKTVAELIPERLTLGELHRVLQALLREGVAIRDLPLIVEALGDAAGATRDLNELVEHARSALARGIAAPHVNAEGELRGVGLDPSLERELTVGLNPQREGGEPLSPTRAREVVTRLVTAVSGVGGETPVIVGPELRPGLAQLLRASLPHNPVLSTHEIPSGTRLRLVATVS